MTNACGLVKCTNLQACCYLSNVTLPRGSPRNDLVSTSASINKLGRVGNMSFHLIQ